MSAILDSIPPREKGGASLAALAALVSVVAHLAVIRRYGWFRDELYYLACGEHLAFGYVDHPPLVALVARIARAAGEGGSLLAARLPAVLAGAAVVFLAGLLAREMGGGRFAQLTAALCALVAPVYLFLFHVLSMNAFDILFWTLGAWIVARIVNTENGKLWLLFGAVCGLALQNKYSILFFGAGVAAGLLLTRQRKHFRSPWIWLGGLVALLLFLPNLAWQAAHGWPTAEFLRNASAFKNVDLSLPAFLGEQVFQMHPLTLPVWLAGLGWLMFSRPGRAYRALGWMWLVVFLITQGSKPYYLAPAYPPLFAAGAVAVERWAMRGRRSVRFPAWALPLLLLAGGAATAPLALPVLPVGELQAYLERLGLEVSSGERHEMGALPQHFADMHGWEEMVAEVARVYRSLPPQERERAGVFTQNYGEAGAVDLLGRRHGLPRASSGHNSYFLWGPQGTGEVLILVGGDPEDHRRVYRDVRQAGEIDCGLCMPYEDGQAVWVAREPKVPLAEIWPQVRSYN